MGHAKGRVRALGDWNFVGIFVTQPFTHHSVVSVALLVELGAGEGLGAEAQRRTAVGWEHTASEQRASSRSWESWAPQGVSELRDLAESGWLPENPSLVSTANISIL